MNTTVYDDRVEIEADGNKVTIHGETNTRLITGYSIEFNNIDKPNDLRLLALALMKVADIAEKVDGQKPLVERVSDELQNQQQ